MPKSFPLQFNLEGCLESDPVHLGLTDSADEGTFVWDDNTTLSTTVYNKWFLPTGEPNNDNGGEE
jgi:hypothetical protein